VFGNLSIAAAEKVQLLVVAFCVSTNHPLPSTAQLLVINQDNNLHFIISQENELTEMRQTIELLRKQSIQAGLTTAHMQSMGVQVNGNNGIKSPNSPTKNQAAAAATANGQNEASVQNGNGTMQRHLSTDSMCSINSNGSNGSSQDKKKKKGKSSLKLLLSTSSCIINSICSCEVPSRKPSPEMPKSPKQTIAK